MTKTLCLISSLFPCFSHKNCWKSRLWKNVGWNTSKFLSSSNYYQSPN